MKKAKKFISSITIEGRFKAVVQDCLQDNRISLEFESEPSFEKLPGFPMYMWIEGKLADKFRKAQFPILHRRVLVTGEYEGALPLGDNPDVAQGLVTVERYRFMNT
jgi:hypothetical protein